MKAHETLEGLDFSRDHDITIAEVKACDIFSNLTDEDAQLVIETFKNCQ